MEQQKNYQLATQVQQTAIQPLPSEGQWAMMQSIASVIGPANNMSAPKMTNIILWGVHLGLTIPASIELIQNVQGKTSLAPRGAWALVQNSPVIAETKLKRLVDGKGVFMGYECYIRRQNGLEFTARWTLEDAKRAGLLKPDSGWEKYPENMCMYRAIGFACDVAASDVTCGLTHFLKMPEQYGLAINDQGDIIDAVSMTSTPNPAAEIERLISEYGADAVLAACDSILPDTMQKCAEIEATIQQAIELEKKASE